MSNGLPTPSPTGGDDKVNKNGGDNDRRALVVEYVRAALAFTVVGLFMGITVVLLL